MTISRSGILCSEVSVTAFKGERQGGQHMVTTYHSKESFVCGGKSSLMRLEEEEEAGRPSKHKVSQG